MHIPTTFKETRVELLHDLIHRYSFGTLVAHGHNGLEVNHLPFEIDVRHGSYGILRGHVARNNPLIANLTSGSKATAIFVGPHAYISPSWYPTMRAEGKGVPTWNYVAVHAIGTIEFLDDSTLLRRHLDRLTDKYESNFARPWRLSDAPPDYVNGLMRGIVAFEIPITRLLGKWKVSQNRHPEDRRAVADALESKCDSMAVAMAELVQTHW